MSHHNPCRPHDCGCWCRNQQRQTAEVSPCELCSCGLCGAGKTEEIHKSKQIHSNTSRCLTTLKYNTSNLGFPVASKIPACYSGTAFQLNLFRRAASSADLLEMHYPASALMYLLNLPLTKPGWARPCPSSVGCPAGVLHAGDVPWSGNGSSTGSGDTGSHLKGTGVCNLLGFIFVFLTETALLV